jgi:hypothetical protein
MDKNPLFSLKLLYLALQNIRIKALKTCRLHGKSPNEYSKISCWTQEHRPFSGHCSDSLKKPVFLVPFCAVRTPWKRPSSLTVDRSRPRFLGQIKNMSYLVMIFTHTVKDIHAILIARWLKIYIKWPKQYGNRSFLSVKFFRKSLPGSRGSTPCSEYRQISQLLIPPPPPTS